MISDISLSFTFTCYIGHLEAYQLTKLNMCKILLTKSSRNKMVLLSSFIWIFFLPERNTMSRSHFIEAAPKYETFGSAGGKIPLSISVQRSMLNEGMCGLSFVF